MASTPWYVLHVSLNHEKRVTQHLTVRCVEHYLPLYSERIKWSDRVVNAERPLFSGYVFVRFPLNDRINVISIPGVRRLLGVGERDMVSSAELEKIRTGLACGLRLRPHPAVSVGTKVRVRNGVFEGVEGLVTQLRQQCKIIISLAAVRQCFSLEVDVSDIEILSEVDSRARTGIEPRMPYGERLVSAGAS